MVRVEGAPAQAAKKVVRLLRRKLPELTRGVVRRNRPPGQTIHMVARRFSIDAPSSKRGPSDHDPKGSDPKLSLNSKEFTPPLQKSTIRKNTVRNRTNTQDGRVKLGVEIGFRGVLKRPAMPKCCL